MSHFVGAVVLPSTLTLDEILAKYYEDLEVPKYLESTKAQIIAGYRERILNYQKGTYAEFLLDPGKYIAECSNQAHIKYLREEFPQKLRWTDEEVYTDAISCFDAKDIDTDGNVYSTRNPLSKWDYWTVGGRWSGEFGADSFPSIAEALQAFKNQSHPSTYVLVTPDGKWHERGSMGWFGVSTGDMEEDMWNSQFLELLETTALTHPSSSVHIIDFHI